MHSGLNHNATQAQKQPLREHIEAVEEQLRRMPIESLSSAQLDWLKVLEVDDLIGPSGLRTLESLLDSSTFDPASSASDAREILDSLNSAESRLNSIGDALAGYDWITEHPAVSREAVEVRIVFKDGVDVRNPSELKKAATDLYEILRGVSLATGHRVEDASITTISRGSLIVTLGTAYAVTKLLAGIVSHVTGMALDSLKTAAAYEELRQKKILTKKLEADLKDEEKKFEEEGRNKLVETLTIEYDGISEEDKRQLERSIDKLLEFFKKGGDLEFLEPPLDDESDDEAEGEIQERLNEIRNHRREVLLLTNGVQDVD